MILVTGASQGIGYECAKALLDRTDSTVMITGRNAARLARARDGLPRPHRDRLLLRVSDQSCPDDVGSLCAELADPRTALEGAILGVGVNPMYTAGPRRLHKVDDATVAAVIRTNCTHTMRLTGVILARLHNQRTGVLIWIGSRAYLAGLPGAGLYCATKAFLSGLARSAHHEYAKHGVRVHLLNPGVVRTPRTAGMTDDFAVRHDCVVEAAGAVAARMVSIFLSSPQEPVEVDL